MASPLVVINYDLAVPTQNSAVITRELNRVGSRRVLKSTWVCENSATIAAIERLLKPYLDPSDRVLICEVTDWRVVNSL